MKKILAGILSCMLLISVVSMPVSATNLNELGTTVVETQATQTTQATQEKQEVSDSPANVDYNTYKNATADFSMQEEDIARAKAYATPIVKIVRVIIALAFAILPLLVALQFVVDIVCLSITPLRKKITLVHAPNFADDGSLTTKIATWSSLESFNALLEAGVTTSSQQGDRHSGMGGMGGFGGGGFGGGGFGGGGFGGSGFGGGSSAPQAPVKTKSLLLSYIKTKTKQAVLMGVCLVLFTCTAFTDLGLKIGFWIVELVGKMLG